MRLLDLRAGNQVVWARRFDRQSNDLLSLQDEIASEVVAQIDPEILLIEAKRSASRPPMDATAYDLMLRAIPLIGRLERGPFMQAGEYLSHAIELEPDYAAAYAWYAYWQMFLVGQGWADDPAAMMAEGRATLPNALSCSTRSMPAGLTIAGHVRAFLHHRLREAIALHERALVAQPQPRDGVGAVGASPTPIWAIRRRRSGAINRYKKLSPLDPHAFFFDSVLHPDRIC